MTGSRARTTRRTRSKRTRGSSAKVAEIVRLVHTLSSDIGSQDGVAIGNGVARLLTDAYRERGRPLPRWVKQLAAHFGIKQGSG